MNTLNNQAESANIGQKQPLKVDLDKNGIVSSEFHRFIADIEDLIKTTHLVAGEDLTKIKTLVNERIAKAKVTLENAGSSVTRGAQKTATITNKYVHDQPWQAIGAGSAIGLLLGYLIARRG